MKNNSDKIKLVKEWFAFASENLLFARAGMKEDFAPYHTICFLCQGSAEKYLKGRKGGHRSGGEDRRICALKAGFA
jgi:hypothetical protein